METIGLGEEASFFLINSHHWLFKMGCHGLDDHHYGAYVWHSYGYIPLGKVAPVIMSTTVPSLRCLHPFLFRVA